MAVRNAWAVSAGGGLISTEDARIAIGGGFMNGGNLASDARSGWLPSPSTITPGQVTPTGTPDAFVHVASFMRIQQSVRGKGPYIWCNDATVNINILSTPADPTNQRNDLIIAQQSDAFYGDASSPLTIKQVVGTPSGSPVDPTVTGSSDFILLARVRVTANATTITSGMIDDLRGLQWTSAQGAVLPVNSVTERNAIPNPYIGLTVYRRDLFWHEHHIGSGVWRIAGIPVVTAFANLASSITHPYDGQIAYVLNDKGIYRYRTAGGWVFAGFTESAGGYARYQQTVINSLSNGADTKIPFQTTVDAPGSVNGTSLVTVTSNTDFALGLAGVWNITTSVRMASVAAGGERFLCLAKSSDIVNTRYAASNAQVPSTGGAVTLTTTTNKRFAAGDSVSVIGFQSSGGSLNTDISMGLAFHLSFNWEGN